MQTMVVVFFFFPGCTLIITSWSVSKKRKQRADLLETDIDDLRHAGFTVSITKAWSDVLRCLPINISMQIPTAATKSSCSSGTPALLFAFFLKISCVTDATVERMYPLGGKWVVGGNEKIILVFYSWKCIFFWRDCKKNKINKTFMENSICCYLITFFRSSLLSVYYNTFKVYPILISHAANDKKKK